MAGPKELVEKTLWDWSAADPTTQAAAIMEAIGRAGLVLRPKPAKLKRAAPGIEGLKTRVRAADNEFHYAMRCHEAWKPAANDPALYERLNHSYVGYTFLAVQQALSREMCLALMRIWDPDTQSLQMTAIVNALSNEEIMKALIAGSAESGDQLHKWADQAISITQSYEEGGANRSVFVLLRSVRNEHLAHREIKPGVLAEIAVGGQDVTAAFETLYTDTAALIGLLFRCVLNSALDPLKEAKLFQRPAELFWAGVRSERDANHPNYHARPMP